MNRPPAKPFQPSLDYRGLDAVFSDAAAWWRPEINLAERAMDPLRVKTIETIAR